MPNYLLPRIIILIILSSTNALIIKYGILPVKFTLLATILLILYLCLVSIIFYICINYLITQKYNNPNKLNTL